MDADRMVESLQDRYLGALIGLAVGDALGAPYEGKPAGTFEVGDEMSGGGTHGLQPGEWTDDTSLALCLATSLLECEGFNPKDQMDRYLRWLRDGYLSSSGRAVGSGRTVAAALERYAETGEPLAGSTDPNTAGNGSLMRLAPIPLYLIHDGARAKELAAQMSRTTHAAAEAVDACRYMTGLIVGALRNESKESLLSDLYSPAYNYWLFQDLALTPRIDAIARGVYKFKEARQLPASGYVVDTLEAALWAFHNSDNFADGVLLAVRLGNDTDTTAAVYGQLAGAFYGYEAIPAPWRKALAHRLKIEEIAVGLLRQTRQGIRHLD
jgi:ADP-ribosylglycohydrolase